MTWELLVEPDRSLIVRAGAHSVAGTARLAFADGSFLDVDAGDVDRLVAFGAQDTPTGRWLVRAVAGAALANAFARGEIPESCGLADLPATAERPSLARAALIVFLARHDVPANRAVWALEALASVASVEALGEWGLADPPIGFASEPLVETARDINARVRLTGSDLIAARAMLGRVAGSAVAPPALRDAAARAMTGIGIGSDDEVDRRFDETVADLEADMPGDLVLDEPLPVLGGEFGREYELAFDDELSLELRGPDGRRWPARMPRLAIDRAHVPAFVSLGVDATVAIDLAMARYTITITSVVVPPDRKLYVRLFNPPSDDDGRLGRMIHLARLDFDDARNQLRAVVDLVPQDFVDGTVPVLAEIVDDQIRWSALPRDTDYWAAATRSDLALLRLLDIDRIGGELRQSVVERVLESSSHLDIEDQEAVIPLIEPTVPLGFVTPTLRPVDGGPTA